MGRVCWNECDAPVVTTIEGVPVCEECAKHYTRALSTNITESDYITADVAVDLRGGGGL